MFLDWIMDRMDAYLTGILSSPIEIIALGAAIAAALLTITSSFVKTMVPLRWLAVCSNFGFFAYGVLHGVAGDGGAARDPAADQHAVACARCAG